MSIRVCSTIILILWHPCLALKFRLSRPMRLPPTRSTVAQFLLSFIGLVFYFLAARSVRHLYSLLPVETHIRYFIIVSHVVPITVCTLPRRCIWSMNFGGTSMAYLPASIRDFLFFDFLNFRLKALIQWFAMTLFLSSGHENSRTLQLPMLHLLPLSPAMPFVPSGKEWLLIFWSHQPAVSCSTRAAHNLAVYLRHLPHVQSLALRRPIERQDVSATCTTCSRQIGLDSDSKSRARHRMFWAPWLRVGSKSTSFSSPIWSHF